MEIVLSGAFPKGEEAYKQSVLDALIIFGKSILKEGYILTFGAHPTFQKIFFDLVNETSSKDYKRVKMYISKYFEKEEDFDTKYDKKCDLKITDKRKNKYDSLTLMRKEMIQREHVKALICIGGMNKTNKKEEGIREEIKLARENDIPVFIIGSAGGCANVVGNEYKKEGWKNLNGAPSTLNDDLLVNPDYFKLAQEVLEFLKK